MVPVLDPGDRLLVLRLPTWWPLRPGMVVALSDPRAFPGGRPIVKRVHAVGGGRVELRGDNPAASTDSRHFGTVQRAVIEGMVVYRYAPGGRTGRVR